jgi:hypothetical protein
VASQSTGGVLVKKFLSVLLVFGASAAIAYLLFSRARKISAGGAEPELDLREAASGDAADTGTQITDTAGSTIGTAN